MDFSISRNGNGYIKTYAYRLLKASIFKHSDRRAALQIDLRRCRINDIDLALHCFLIFIKGIGQRIGPQLLRLHD